MPSSAGPAGNAPSVLSLCSLLHERARVGSATRLLGPMSVLRHTVERLAKVNGVGGVAVLCWNDQVEAVATTLEGTAAQVLPHGPRQTIASIEAIDAAQRWCDGWRGGLLQSIPQDRGFFAPTALAVAKAVEADAVLLVDPASPFLDSALCEGLIDRFTQRSGHDLYFTPAAPGLCGLLVRRDMLETLAGSQTHPGRSLTYLPDHPRIDPVAGDNCVHGPTSAARTLHDFRIDSARKAAWAERLLDASSGADSLIAVADALPALAPRDLTIELTTARVTRPIWLTRARETALAPESARQVIQAAAAVTDDLRLTLGIMGDPLCHDDWLEIVAAARAAGVEAIHAETDLLADAATIVKLAAAVDVISVHLPAVTSETYAAVMGVDRFDEVKGNLARLIATRDALKRGTPLIVPTFIKTRPNLAEMEPWYDHWITLVGSAVVRGPDAMGNEPPADVAAAPMIRSERMPREWRLLADGSLQLDGCDIAPAGGLSTTALETLFSSPAAIGKGGETATKEAA